MRPLTLALLLAILPLAASACSEEQSEAPSGRVATEATGTPLDEAPAGPLQAIALRVPDMSCRLCARPIEHHLREMGVRDVSADLKTKWVTGRFDPERLSPEEIRDKVEALRFRVTEVRVG